MRVLSLFDGIATGRLALEMAGVPVDLYIASEIDKDAKAVARANWPDMIHIGPVENVTAPDLPKIDLVIGGSPCQGFSRAGAGLNFNTEQGGQHNARKNDRQNRQPEGDQDLRD